jgi:hypothetical protein
MRKLNHVNDELGRVSYPICQKSLMMLQQGRLSRAQGEMSAAAGKGPAAPTAPTQHPNPSADGKIPRREKSRTVSATERGSLALQRYGSNAPLSSLDTAARCFTGGAVRGGRQGHGEGSLISSDWQDERPFGRLVSEPSPRLRAELLSGTLGLSAHGMWAGDLPG